MLTYKRQKQGLLGIVGHDRNGDGRVIQTAPPFNSFRVLVKVAEFKFKPRPDIDARVELQFRDAGKEGSPAVNVIGVMDVGVVFLFTQFEGSSVRWHRVKDIEVNRFGKPE